MAHAATLKVPGFGLPLKQIPEWSRKGKKLRFPHAIADFYATEGITLRERRMLDFINQVTDKPRWQEKIYDAEIEQIWRTEACGSINQQEVSPKHLSQKCFDYCMKELKDKAAYLEKYGVIHVLDVEATIVKVDVADGDTLCPTLVEAVRPLEDVPDIRKDWHPGSREIVLDLVHPSLFPLQYGKSRVLPNGSVGLSDCSKYICCGVQCPIPQETQGEFGDRLVREKSFSDHSTLRPWGSYQWLPSDIRLYENGSARIESYVNNLHPQQHAELYPVLEKAVERAVPLWNECLSFFHTRLRIQVTECGYNDFRNPSLLPSWRKDEHNEDDDEDSAIHDWLQNNPEKRELIHPEPHQEFLPFEQRVVKESQQRLTLSKHLSNRIQVIFKLATIHLTPDKPHYSGSEWHVEGALNEHICATALIYYDQDNIEDSYLAFRHEVDAHAMISKPPQGEYEAVEDMFGVEYSGEAVQDLGKVLTRKGRILAFPNVMQHRVQPFGLADRSKPGYRKILAMFLVDPHIKILSTSNVPPQRRDWWAEELRLIEPFSTLPVELFDRLIELVEDFPISFEKACEMRKELMTERGRAAEEYDEMLRSDTFFFCEH